MTREYLGLAGLDLGYLLVGSIALVRLGFISSAESALRYAGLALVVGWSWFGVLASITLMLGLSIGGWWVVVALIAAAGLPLALPLPRAHDASTRLDAAGRMRALALAVAGVLATYGAFLLGRAFASTADTNWDSWAFWIPKAQAIFYFGGLDTAPGGFTSFANPEYPPLAPATEAAAFHAMGAVETIALPVQHWVLAVAFVTAVAGLLSTRVPARILWPFVAMLGIAPTFGKYALSSLADPQVAYLVALGGVATAIWLLDREAPYALVAGLFLTAAALTKTEGFLLAAVVPAALLLAQPRELRTRWRAIAALAAGPTAGFVAWKLWLAAHDQPLGSTLYDVTDAFDPVYLAERLDRWGYALREVLVLLLAPDRWLFVLPVAVAAAALALRPRRQLATFALTWLTVAFLGLTSVYWIASVDVEWYVATSAERVTMSIGMFAGAVAPLLVAETWGVGRRRVEHIRAQVTPRALAVGVGLVLVAYVGIRLALVWRFPPFVDEALYATWALQAAENSDLAFASLASGKEPLLPWLGAIFVWLGFEPLTGVRLVSVLAGIATLTCTALIARELGGRIAAYTAAAMYVLVPFFVVHDVIGIYDPLATATATAALLLQIRIARSGGIVATSALGLVLGAGLLTKQTMYLSIALIPLGLLLLDWHDEGRVARALSWAAKMAAASAIAVAAYSILLFSEHYEELGRVRDIVYPTHSVSAALSSPVYWIERNWPPHREALVGYLTLPVIALVLIGVVLGLRRVPQLSLVVLAWGVAPIAAAVLIGDATYPRYLLAGIPPLVALGAYGAAVAFAFVRALLPDRRAVALSACVVLLGLAPALVVDWRVLRDPATATYPSTDDEQYATGWPAGAPWKPLAQDLKRRQGGEPATVLLGEQGSEALRLLLRDRPNLTVVREADGTTLYGVANGVPLDDPPGAVTWRELATYPRPRGGTTLALYERGVRVSGVFASSPDELRRELTLPDAAFDAFLAAHPDVHAWYDDWYAAHPAEPG